MLDGPADPCAGLGSADIHVRQLVLFSPTIRLMRQALTHMDVRGRQVWHMDVPDHRSQTIEIEGFVPESQILTPES